MSRAQEQNGKVQSVVSSHEEDAVKIDQITKIRGWFRPEDESPFYATIQKYMAQEITLEEASNQVFTPIDGKINAEKLDDVNFTDLWYSVIHTARRTYYREDHQHQTIVDFVQAFKAHSISDNEKYNYLYNSLIDFNMACREAYNDQPTPGSSFDIETTAWTNMNFFFALITGKEISDLSMFAIWALRQGLEYEHSDDEQSTAVQKYNTYVPAAAVWVFGGFRVLFEKEEDLTPKNDNEGDPARGGDLWKGKSEFSKARWYFWRERFAQIGDMDEASADTWDVARDAVNAMERAATFEKI
ncbi:hypothetical protein CC86DRAFT_344903 [Ophiobolus disseminans]|uniref:Uncharacterized protein n=1 Tax=Ophiobolus disseminans TaxID=1469910 RepID=A0A6A7ABI0_9PLEO|nr:hypothetical protein CC86DRAFT_344903 [Ophiobolus disseminans]